jgi:phosphoribosylformylglycinamidine synthase PurS subunit
MEWCRELTFEWPLSLIQNSQPFLPINLFPCFNTIGLNGLGKIGGFVARVLINVVLKPEILDPQGRAILGALGRVGISGVTDVRQGKQFALNIDGDINEAKLAQIREIAATLLSNPVIEDFTVQVCP